MPLSLACLALTLVAAEPQPQMIKAWRGAGEAKEYPTRTLVQLPDYTPTEPETSKYGGWLGERHEATGYFRSEKLGDRWWLVDPEGYRYLHMAVNSVSAGGTPTNQKVFPEKFGTQDRWREATVDLLAGAGFNGLGNWSDPATINGGERKLAYCSSNSFMGAYGRKRGGVYQASGHLGFPKNLIFVFDPEFKTFAEEYARERLTATKDDPWLLGHFTDNELPYSGEALAGYLSLPAEDPGHQAALAWLAERGRTPADAIRDEDKWAFKGHVLETYLKIVCEAIRAVDPNHLILGPRFHGGDRNSRTMFEIAGRYLDVVAVNIYSVWTPTEEVDKLAGWSGKPILPTEWYAKGQDSGMENLSGAGWTVATQADRGAFYQNFCLGLLESPNAVGWHWFKYMDNDPADTKADPSNRNSNKGMVTCAYEPYPPLLEAMRQLNAQAYPLTAWFDRRVGF